MKKEGQHAEEIKYFSFLTQIPFLYFKQITYCSIYKIFIRYKLEIFEAIIHKQIYKIVKKGF